MARCFCSLFCPGISGERLRRLVEWCDRYTPLAAADGSDGIILDITGCTQLFGGEGALLVDLQRRLQRLGIAARGAIADAWGIAWALARYGKRRIVHGENAAAALAALPVEALRLSQEVVFELRRLGLTSISEVKKLSRESLAVRFGASFVARLDQIFEPSCYQAGEPLTPWRPPAPYRASRSVAEPVATTGAVGYVLSEVLGELCERLEKNRLGARHMDFACWRVDGTVDRCEIRTSKPTRSVTHLMRLFEDPLGALRADFGFETFVLSVLDSETLDARQLGLFGTNPVEDEKSLEALVDRFGMKLGFSQVNRIRVCESFWPEQAVEFRPASAPQMANADWPMYRVRPVRLIEPPMRIEVSILIPGGSPVQFLVGQRKHRIVRSEGPERLTPEWWREPAAEWSTRDYYRIEDEQGFRFWIFRDSREHWYLHGHLA